MSPVIMQSTATGTCGSMGSYIALREGHQWVPYTIERHGDKWHYRAGHWDDD